MKSVRNTIAFAELRKAVERVGGLTTAVQSLNDTVGLRVSALKMKKWLSGEMIPTNAVKASGPSPGERHLVNTWIGIPDEYWWTEEEKQQKEKVSIAWGFFSPDEQEVLGGY